MCDNVWWPNDDTYQGVEQNSPLKFKSPLNDADHWVLLSDEIKEKLKCFIISKDNYYDRNILSPGWLNSYDNNDYLWLAYELEHLREIYNASQRMPITGKLIDGHHEIPYVPIKLTENAKTFDTLYPKAKINGYKNDHTPHYIIEFEHGFLKAFITFLSSIFDDNPQQFTEKDNKKHIEYQHKAPIYRQAPFDKYFHCRHDLIATIIHKAVQMLLAHELAHVGGGHLDLQENDREYGTLRDTILVEENDADAQAICWLLGIRYLEVPYNQLEISYDDFRQELALTVFSIYVLYTWNYSKDDRVWSDKVMEEYYVLQKNHLPYQLRAYNMICLCCNRMQTLGIWYEKDHTVSSDNKPITVSFMLEAFHEGMDMIKAFEYAYHMFFARTENIYELALDGKYDELCNICLKEQEMPPVLSKHHFPWRLGYEDSAQLELKRIYELWPEVREKLIKNGTYCVLKPIVPWIPLKNNFTLL